MEFKINKLSWKIREVNEEDISENVLGETNYKLQEVKLLKSLNQELKERTLKHELVHVWLWAYGHNQNDRNFDNEDVCEIVANINDFINEIVSKYLSKET